MDKINILNKTIQIEDCNGNIIMGFELDNFGNIINLFNCEIADIDKDLLFNTKKDMLRFQKENF